MNIFVAENIRRLRREHGMTQEELAEAMCVSIAAISKWERGQAVPDLSYIVQLADLFEISVDALIGYEVQNGTCDALEKRIHTLQKEKKFDEAEEEAEKALVRYPNNFALVYRCAEVFQLKGMENGERASIKRSITLWEKAITLLSQNRNADINEFTLQAEIAQCYIALGKVEKGIELLKKCNIGGIHNATIGMIYSESSDLNSEEALPYLTQGFAESVICHLRIVDGYKRYYEKKTDYKSAKDTALWLINYFNSIRLNDKIIFLDKYIAMLYADCSCYMRKLGDEEEAKLYEMKAYEHADKFDESPSYIFKNVRFVISEMKDNTVYDSSGQSARGIVQNSLKKGEEHETLE